MERSIIKYDANVIHVILKLLALCLLGTVRRPD